MPPTLFLAPDTSGKTEDCIERVGAVQQENPLAPVRGSCPTATRRARSSGAAHGGRGSFCRWRRILDAQARRALGTVATPLVYRTALRWLVGHFM